MRKFTHSFNQNPEIFNPNMGTGKSSPQMTTTGLGKNFQ